MAEWIKTAKAGDRVVCTKRGAWFLVDGVEAPRKPAYGEEYVIHNIEVFEALGIVAISVVGIEGHWWEAVHFRPVQPRDTDISIFTDMLKTTSKPLEMV